MARVKPAQITDELNDIWRLVVGYAKQETVSPLRGLAKFAQWGFMGMICFALASAFASLAVLRGLQYETTLSSGNWSFVPYVVSIVGCAIVLVVAARSAARTPWKKDKGDSK